MLKWFVSGVISSELMVRLNRLVLNIGLNVVLFRFYFWVRVGIM